MTLLPIAVFICTSSAKGKPDVNTNNGYYHYAYIYFINELHKNKTNKYYSY
ncbi:hypothetical protein BN1088_1432823 [Sphingobacterium sp. PM2-P1-29]|nr:hypothetical protein BN1088_1432823 [Sphingobacterium sp. PM2-P1-29]